MLFKKKNEQIRIATTTDTKMKWLKLKYENQESFKLKRVYLASCYSITAKCFAAHDYSSVV